jgi:hypothetical protein
MMTGKSDEIAKGGKVGFGGVNSGISFSKTTLNKYSLYFKLLVVLACLDIFMFRYKIKVI